MANVDCVQKTKEKSRAVVRFWEKGFWYIMREYETGGFILWVMRFDHLFYIPGYIYVNVFTLLHISRFNKQILVIIKEKVSTILYQQLYI